MRWIYVVILLLISAPIRITCAYETRDLEIKELQPTPSMLGKYRNEKAITKGKISIAKIFSWRRGGQKGILLTGVIADELAAHECVLLSDRASGLTLVGASQTWHSCKWTDEQPHAQQNMQSPGILFFNKVNITGDEVSFESSHLELRFNPSLRDFCLLDEAAEEYFKCVQY